MYLKDQYLGPVVVLGREPVAGGSSYLPADPSRAVGSSVSERHAHFRYGTFKKIHYCHRRQQALLKAARCWILMTSLKPFLLVKVKIRYDC